jgi:hypothetical protein
VTVNWQYGTALRDPDGTVWDYYPEGDEGWTLDRATEAANEWNEEEGESPSVCIVVRRRPPSPAGGWKPVPLSPDARPGDPGE